MTPAEATLTGLAASTFTLGVLLIVSGLRRTRGNDAAAPPTRPADTRAALLRKLRGRTATAALVGSAAGMLLYLLSGWFIAIPAGIGGAFLVAAARTGRTSKQVIAQLDALQEWTLMLSGLMIGNQSLQQAIVESARSAPPAIAGPVSTLAQRLTHAVDPARALRLFADELDDATADLIASTLLLGFREPRGLANVMRRLAASVAEDAKNRRALESARALPRASAAVVTLVLSLIVLFVLVTSRSYLDAYSTPAGQVILVGLTTLYGGLLWWMNRISRPPVQPRIIGTTLPGAPTPPAPLVVTR